MKARERKRSQKEQPKHLVLRFIHPWSKVSREVALECFGCDLSGENQEVAVGFLIAILVSVSFFFTVVTRPVLAINWHQTQGQLIKKEFIENRIRINSKRHHYSRMEVTYSYVHDGRTYYGKRINFALLPGSGYSWIPEQGRSIRVYYDPQSPGNSVLNRSPPWTELIVSSLLVLVLGFFSGSLIYSACEYVLTSRNNSVQDD